MAQGGIRLDEENFSCSICLDLLKDPVTIPCGHSYCMNCIKDHWDGEDQRRIPSCPQCRKEFKPRPELEKNVMLAALVEDLKKTGLQDAPADHCYAGPEDVACDVCTGKKMKAVKTCLVCLISYCENHLQPHYESPAFQKHKLVNPTKTLMESICSCHDEVMKMLMDGYETVSAEAERAEKQKELQKYRQQIHQRIQDQEKVLSVQSLTGRCYWEVERTGRIVGVGVSYKDPNIVASLFHSKAIQPNFPDPPGDRQAHSITDPLP
ncbi:E3 ubiquitin/ISG15 ligase TRIM25-like [Poecilia latipinna]|uniref:E3 ubiquitin/ISG15 ligase TRIM25-like n=1 Tax=Poecilia latipinna TaxID=48699 RepID=UPI00072DA7BA|nr:PREDICTED: E3 ubiquitin/ISG15 ligase TRIM25-like [Poecilia latipinna]